MEEGNLQILFQKLLEKAVDMHKESGMLAKKTMIYLATTNPKQTQIFLSHCFSTTKSLDLNYLLILGQIYHEICHLIDIESSLLFFNTLQSFYLVQSCNNDLYDIWREICKSFINNANISSKIYWPETFSPISLITFEMCSKFSANDILLKFENFQPINISLCSSFFYSFINEVSKYCSFPSQFLSRLFPVLFSSFQSHYDSQALNCMNNIFHSLLPYVCPISTLSVSVKLSEMNLNFSTISPQVLASALALLISLSLDHQTQILAVEFSIKVLLAKSLPLKIPSTHFPIEAIDPSCETYIFIPALSALVELAKNIPDQVISQIQKHSICFFVFKQIFSKNPETENQHFINSRIISFVNSWISSKKVDSIYLSDLLLDIIPFFSPESQEVLNYVNYIAKVTLHFNNSFYFEQIPYYQPLFQFLFASNLVSLLPSTIFTIFSNCGNNFPKNDSNTKIDHQPALKDYPFYNILIQKPSSEKAGLLIRIFSSLISLNFKHKYMNSLFSFLNYFCEIIFPIAYSDIKPLLDDFSHKYLQSKPSHNYNNNYSETPQNIENTQEVEQNQKIELNQENVQNQENIQNLENAQNPQLNENSTDFLDLFKGFRTPEQESEKKFFLINELLPKFKDQQFLIAVCSEIIKEVESNNPLPHIQSSILLFLSIIQYLPLQVGSLYLGKLFSSFHSDEITSFFAQVIGRLPSKLVIELLHKNLYSKKTLLLVEITNQLCQTISNSQLFSALNSDLLPICTQFIKKKEVNPSSTLKMLVHLFSRCTYKFNSQFKIKNGTIFFNYIMSNLFKESTAITALCYYIQIPPCFTLEQFSTIREKVLSPNQIINSISDLSFWNEIKELIIAIWLIKADLIIFIAIFEILLPILDFPPVISLIHYLLTITLKNIPNLHHYSLQSPEIFSNLESQEIQTNSINNNNNNETIINDSSLQFYNQITIQDIPVTDYIVHFLAASKTDKTKKAYECAEMLYILNKNPEKDTPLFTQFTQYELNTMSKFILIFLKTNRSKCPNYTYVLSLIMDYISLPSINELCVSSISGKLLVSDEFLQKIAIQQPELFVQTLLKSNDTSYCDSIFDRTINQKEAIEVIQQQLCILLPTSQDLRVLSLLLRCLNSSLLPLMVYRYQVACSLIIYAISRSESIQTDFLSFLYDFECNLNIEATFDYKSEDHSTLNNNNNNIKLNNDEKLRKLGKVNSPSKTKQYESHIDKILEKLNDQNNNNNLKPYYLYELQLAMIKIDKNDENIKQNIVLNKESILNTIIDEKTISQFISQMFNIESSLLIDVMNFLMSTQQLNIPQVSLSIATFCGEVASKVQLNEEDSAIFNLFYSTLLSFASLFDETTSIFALNGILMVLEANKTKIDYFPTPFISRTLQTLLNTAKLKHKKVSHACSIVFYHFCNIFKSKITEKLHVFVFELLIEFCTVDEDIRQILDLLLRMEATSSVKYFALAKIINFYKSFEISKIISPEKNNETIKAIDENVIKAEKMVLNIFLESEVDWMIKVSLKFMKSEFPELISHYLTQILRFLDSENEEIVLQTIQTLSSFSQT